ncbi:MAG TPA: hypothetical protein VKA34_06610 [Balneolales bacterium]|nr:hypothetical protein [Balneolales bacterium]
MKSKLFIIILLLFSTSNVFAETTHTSDDSLLYHVQGKIKNAFLNSFQSHNPAKLETIEKKLKNFKNTNRIVQYWRAYTLCYESIYHIKMGNKRASLKKLKKGINILKIIKTKSSDDYALLAMMQGYAIQFSGGMHAAVLATKAKRNAQNAVDLDKKNVRAWYVQGLNNYHTPKQFGGKTIVKICLTKAISLKEENRQNPYLPTWGKVQSYGLLVTFYINQKKFAKAQKVLKTGLKKYPDNYTLKQDEKTLADK